MLIKTSRRTMESNPELRACSKISQEGSGRSRRTWGVVDEFVIGEKFRALAGELNERQRRLWAASEARAAGRGGISATARATGMADNTIRKGIVEMSPASGWRRGGCVGGAAGVSG